MPTRSDQSHRCLQLLRDLRSCKAAAIQERGRCDVDVVAAKLAHLGYRVAVRTAVGGGHGQDCFQVGSCLQNLQECGYAPRSLEVLLQNVSSKGSFCVRWARRHSCSHRRLLMCSFVQHLHHVFLVVTPPGGGAPCIADPTFRSNFQLSDMHTTAAYAAALPTCESLALAPQSSLCCPAQWPACSLLCNIEAWCRCHSHCLHFDCCSRRVCGQRGACCGTCELPVR